MRIIKDKSNNQEPGRSEKETAWLTAIGLQASDGLRTSDYLLQTAQKNIEGKISIDDANESVNSYYFEKNAHDAGDPESEDADKTAVNITRILLTETFDLSIVGLASLHRGIFDGVYENAGIPREADVSKREWVLGGDIVNFMNPEALPNSLEQCIAKERHYRYDAVPSDTLISHLADFVSKIWQMCPFGEGNTRFTAVLTLLHLRQLGICYNFETFKNDSWYFHNALVRANYRNVEKNIDYEPIYLERFFRNLLLSEQWDLRNRYVHVRPAAEWRTQSKANTSTNTGQVQIKKSTTKVKEKDNKEISKRVVIVEEQHLETTSTTENPNILFLTVAIGEDFLSVKDIMKRLNLRGRDNFLKLYLTPALHIGIVSLLYPGNPRHPRQKYLLTQKGLDFLNNIDPEMRARTERHLAKNMA